MKDAEISDYTITSGELALENLFAAESFILPFIDDEYSKYIMMNILVDMGLIYMDFIGDLGEAEKVFLRAKQMEELNRLQDLPQVVDERLAWIGAQKTNPKTNLNIEWKRRKGIVPLIEFVLKNNPPIHSTSFNPEDWKNPIEEIDKKILIKLVKLYHTDKVDRSRFDDQYFCIVEEISKCLGEALNKIKDKE
jgi:hypothetical protein